MTIANGPSKLSVVSRIMNIIGNGSIDALDSTGTWPNITYGTSEQGQIERKLDEEVATVLTGIVNGPNTDFMREFVPTNGEIVFSTLPYPVLKVAGAGKNELGRYTIRGGKLYDQWNSTSNFGTTPVTLKVAFNMPFDDMDPLLRSYVAARATLGIALASRLVDGVRLQLLAAEVDRVTAEVTNEFRVQPNRFPVVQPLGIQAQEQQ